MKNPKSETTKTVLTITIGFLVIYLITKWKWTISVSLIIGLMGILSSYLSKKIDFFWIKLTWLLSVIVPNILLSVIFFLFLLPIAILSRIFGRKDPLSLKNTANSLFKNSNKKFDKDSFEKPW